jgi:hypothetical protein
VACVLAGAAAAVEPADPDPNSTRTMEALLPELDERPGYPTSDTCRSCHPAEYRSWYDSYHRPMTQVASAETVLADFDGVQLDHYRVGQRLLLGTHEGQLYFEPLGLIRGPPDPARALDLEKARRIVLTTGSHHQQTFWVVGYQNQLFSFPFSWLVDDGRWAPRDDIILRDPSLPMGTAGWNSNCVDCHATPPGTHYERELAGASGELSELGIACEACHGGAEAHVNQSRSPLLRYEQHLDSERDMAIVRPAKLSAEASSQICGQCHAKVRYYIPQPGTEHRPYRPGDDLLETRILKRFGHRMQHTAGQELNVMVESACYRGGELSCLSCHSMHGYADRSDQLAPGMDGDAACQQCHSQAKYTTELATHTKHPAESAGSRCYECHMPKTTFGLRKAIRSHVIDSPRVQSADAPQRSERPQACNLCHLDRSLGWTAEALTKLWGQPAPSLDDDEKTVANSVLWLAKGDAAQRAVVADAMGRDVAWQASGKRWLAPFLASTLDDRYGVVRYVAGRSLARLPGFEGFEADFVAREEMRRLDRARALRRWHRTIKGSPDRTGSEILITPDGTLDTKRWEALRAGRSTRQLDQIE